MIKKRKVTITMEINSDTHIGWVTEKVYENGKIKKKWTPSEAMSTADSLIRCAHRLLESALPKSIEIENAIRKEEELDMQNMDVKTIANRNM